MKFSDMNRIIRSSAYKMSLPIPEEKVRLWGFISDTVASALRNRVVGRPDMTMVGDVTIDVGGSFGNFKSLSNYFKTGVIGPTKFDASGTAIRSGATIFIVCWTNDTLADIAHRPIFLGAENAPPIFQDTATITTGFLLRVFAANALSMQSSRGNTVSDDVSGLVNLSSPAIVNTAPALLVVRRPAGNGVNTFLDYTTGASGTSSGGSLPDFPSELELLLGSGYLNYAGTNCISEIVICEELTALEEAAVVKRIRENQFQRWVRTI